MPPMLPALNGHSTRPRLNLAIDLDGVLTEHPRPLALAASQKFGLDLPERAFVDSAGLNVPQAVRDWVSDRPNAMHTANAVATPGPIRWRW